LVDLKPEELIKYVLKIKQHNIGTAVLVDLKPEELIKYVLKIK